MLAISILSPSCVSMPSKKIYTFVPVHDEFTCAELLRFAAGRWLEIGQSLGLPVEQRSCAKGMPCPKCGGRDRFCFFNDFENRGAVHCRHCHNGHTDPRSGNGLATIRWWQGSAINEAAQWLSQWIGVDFKHITSTIRNPSPLQTTTVKQIISPVFQAYAETCFKNISSSQYCYIAKKLGVSITALQQLMVGWSPEEYATSWPLRNGHGEVIGIRFRRVSNGAKWSLKGGRNGLAYDPHILQSGSFNRLWIAEGQSDTAALLSAGVAAVGIPNASSGLSYLDDLCHRLLPSEIILVADQDQAGEVSARNLAQHLFKFAPIKIITPPGGHKDVRDWMQAGGTTRDLLELVTLSPIVPFRK